MDAHQFESVVQHSGEPGTWSTMPLPPDVSSSLGGRARVPVKGTINDVPFRSSAMPAGDGGFFVVVNQGLQKQAGVKPGDRVHVVLERDDEPREVEVPPELAQALAKDAEASRAFQAMSYSRHKEYVDWILDARSEETRQRRAARAVEMIRHGKRLKGG
jgi:hypothetical protein